MGNVTVAWEDVWAVVEQVLPQLITIIVVLAWPSWSLLWPR